MNTADARRTLDTLLASHTRLSEWMREHTGPSDGTLAMLVEAHHIAATTAEILAADSADFAPLTICAVCSKPGDEQRPLAPMNSTEQICIQCTPRDYRPRMFSTAQITALLATRNHKGTPQS